MNGLKQRRGNLKLYLKKRHSQEELLETSIREEHDHNPVGNIEKRLRGARRERLSDKTRHDK